MATNEEIREIIVNNTPLYNDIVDIILQYTQPKKFKVGDIICNKINTPMFVIVKKNLKSFRVKFFNRERKYKIGENKATILTFDKDKKHFGLEYFYDKDNCFNCDPDKYKDHKDQISSIKCSHSDYDLFDCRETFSYIDENDIMINCNLSKLTENIKLKYNKIGDEYMPGFIPKWSLKPYDVFKMDKYKIVNVPEYLEKLL